MRDLERIYSRELPTVVGDAQTWEDMEEVWNHTLKQLNTTPTEVAGIVITGRASDTKHRKEEIIQTLVESLEVNNCYLANSSAMALYSVGKTNGLVIKSGESLTRAVPIFEGTVIQHAV